MNTFASEFLDSVKDVVVEGVVPYFGLMPTYLTVGRAVNIAGSEGLGGPAYTTGWESLALPVVSCEVAFQPGNQGTSYMMALHVSNRRGRYSAETFLKPSITGMSFGGAGGDVLWGKAATMDQGGMLGREGVEQLAALGQERGAAAGGPRGAEEGAAAGRAGYGYEVAGTQAPGMVDTGADTAERDKYGRAARQDYQRPAAARLKSTQERETAAAERG
jgi:hypothetical protein